MSTETLFVNALTNGIIGPSCPMLGPVKDGGFIVANTAPGCWGPMLTPAIRGGHEVTQPVAVEGATAGDAIAIRIVSINVTSDGTASGNDTVNEDRFLGDPFVAGKCPGCGTLYPETHLEGVGPEAVRCNNCGSPASPFKFTSGYTIAFDEEARKWYALNDDIPILLEDASLDVLISRVKLAAPEMLEINNLPHAGASLLFKMEAQAVVA